MDQHHALVFASNCQLVAAESPILYKQYKQPSQEQYLRSWFGTRYLGGGLIKCAYCFQTFVMSDDSDDVCTPCREAEVWTR